MAKEFHREYSEDDNIDWERRLKYKNMSIKELDALLEKIEAEEINKVHQIKMKLSARQA